ncbi:7-cyano-7-deazaguanine synthase QueC [Thermoplasmatales archaeon ex4572_165]|nr:MAG: 7-cyano-7-deazaguanine synthase QueC [Thermoplasmatales archaeon ex4572_165]RLF59865.1 MAG: 7-cyano-7-deazaguanine synthase QueC [Thermoplasmata archaeon]
MNKRSVILISGGLDSAVTAFYAKQESSELYGLSFLYGQKHNREIDSAKKIGIEAKLKDHVFFTLDLNQFGGSSLLKNSKETIPNNVSVEEIGKEIPSTYVPARNTIFLSIALAYAETIDADFIFIGVTSEDYSGYPDCRPAFIDAFQNLINNATKKTILGKNIRLNTPLLKLSKDEIIKKGINLNVPFEKTWSCYQGKDKACGICDSCKLRLKGFKNAGLPDPISYITTPEWYDLS